MRRGHRKGYRRQHYTDMAQEIGPEMKEWESRKGRKKSKTGGERDRVQRGG